MSHGLHNRQSVGKFAEVLLFFCMKISQLINADFFLPSNMLSVSDAVGRANRIAGAYLPDPTLAAAVNSAALQSTHPVR